MAPPINPESAMKSPIDTFCIIDTDVWLQIPSLFSYQASEPFTVKIDFTDPDIGVVTWKMARLLLLQGMGGVSGEGDVVVYPADIDKLVGFTAIRLAPPNGEATLYARTEAVARFVTDTMGIVAMGQEHQFIDLGPVLDEILNTT